MSRPRESNELKAPSNGRVALANELRKLYGGALTLHDLMETLGYKDQKSATRWVKENRLDAVVLNGGRKKWLVTDVARVLDNSKIAGASA